MPFVPNTPEAHAALTDLTSSPHLCRGVNNEGRRCKTSVTRCANGEPATGIITKINNIECFFCVKHQDQANDVALRHTASFAQKRALVNRSSMETLIEQVEMLVAGDGPGATISTTMVSTSKRVPKNKDPFHPQTDDDSEVASSGVPKPPSPPASWKPPHRHEKPKRSGLSKMMLSCCCADDEEEPVNEKATEAELRAAAAKVVDENHPKQPLRPPKKDVPSAATSKATVIGKGMSPATPATLDEDSDDENVAPLDVSTMDKKQKALMDLIPNNIKSRNYKRLQEELLTPFSDKDEPGYIYIFWLNDSPISPNDTPDRSPSPAKPNSLAPPRPGITPTPQQKTHSKALFSRVDSLQVAGATPGGHRPKVLLKIGRANNVQRRLSEWTAQCGHNLSLIRYYPHTSVTSSSSGPLARKVPNSHRIEHLIHLELSATPGCRNPKRPCESCGRTHKEWFEVDATREGILHVDEAVKKWVEYGERSATKGSPGTDDTPRSRSKSPLPPARPVSGTPSSRAKSPLPPTKNTNLAAPSASGANGRSRSKSPSPKKNGNLAAPSAAAAPRARSKSPAPAGGKTARARSKSPLPPKAGNAGIAKKAAAAGSATTPKRPVKKAPATTGDIKMYEKTKKKKSPPRGRRGKDDDFVVDDSEEDENYSD